MSKKSESIEFRVSPELKDDLVRKSAAEGETMSGYLRSLVDRDVSGRGAQSSEQGWARRALGRRGGRYGVVALLLLVGAYLGLERPVPRPVQEIHSWFAELDRNGDGEITEQEYFQAHEGTDLDLPDLPPACVGSSVEEEFAMTDAEVLRRDVLEIDANGDKVIRFDELAAVMKRDAVDIFLEVDRDANGFLTRAEIIAADTPAPWREGELAEASGVSGLSPACIMALEALEGNPLLNLAEWDDVAGPEAYADLFLADFDTDEDGMLSIQEVAGY